MNKDNKLNQTFLASWRSPLDLACTALAVVLGFAIGWLDLYITEVLVTIVLLLGGSLLLGLLQPVAAWRWAVLITIGLPVMVTIAHITGMQTAEPARLDVRIALVALTFTFLGSYVGVFLRRTFRGLSKRSRPTSSRSRFDMNIETDPTRRRVNKWRHGAESAHSGLSRLNHRAAGGLRMSHAKRETISDK